MSAGKVLIIEDNSLNRELIRDLLEARGYAVITAWTAEEGIELAQREAPDLILMDLRLPGIDGLTATGLLKKDPATREIPIFALTAQTMKGDREQALQAGCDGYIPKPIDTRELSNVVTRAIQAVAVAHR